MSQARPDLSRGSGDKPGSDTSSISSLPDTISIRYFNINDLDTYYDYQDSVLDFKVHNYDPARNKKIDYIHLGNQGSAAAPLRYTASPKIGFTEGHKQYDLYKLDLRDFKFYEGNVPVVQADFSPMGSQEDFVVRANFTRSFSDGVTVSSNYQRVLQEGVYANQATKITNFGVSIKYEHPGKRYVGFLSMISNVAEENNNGGPRDLSTLESRGRGNRELVDTHISDAVTRHQQKYYSLINYYKLNSKRSKLDLRVRYDIGYDASYVKYSDAQIGNVNDQNFYGDLAVDFRGLRNYTRISKVNNAFYTYLTDKNRLDLRVGVVYDRYSIDQDSTDVDVDPAGYDNVYLDFDGQVPFFKSLTLITKAQFGIGDGAGDFNIDGGLDINIGKIGTLKGGLAFYRESPSLLQQSYFLSQVKIWSNEDFLKPLGSKIYGQLSIPYLNLDARVEQHIVDNAIYYDTLGRPQQKVEDIYSATTLTLRNQIHFSIFNLENTALIQLINDNIYGLPSLWSKHNFYLEFPMFKKNLLARWGVETRLTPSYDGLAYNPAIGVFHQNPGEEIAFYPMTDVYFSGKVQKFRLFIKLENLNQLIDNTKVDFRVANYPQQDWTIRFGVSWLFLG